MTQHIWGWRSWQNTQLGSQLLAYGSCAVCRCTSVKPAVLKRQLYSEGLVNYSESCSS
jgi:hypothetical protein